MFISKVPFGVGRIAGEVGVLPAGVDVCAIMGVLFVRVAVGISVLVAVLLVASAWGEVGDTLF